jgi:hypothetical protein
MSNDKKKKKGVSKKAVKTALKQVSAGRKKRAASKAKTKAKVYSAYKRKRG